jgi:excisionase family DNA binding protein
MNPTTRAILQSILSSDHDLTGPESEALRRISSGTLAAADDPEPCLLLTQKQAAQQLSVSRMTLWRLTKQGVLRPVRITPSTWRYRSSEIEEFARAGCCRTKPAATSGAGHPNDSEIFSEARQRSGSTEESSLPNDWKPP